MENVVVLILFIIGLSVLIIFIGYKLAPAAEEAGNKGIIKAWVLESSRWKLTKIVFSAEPPSYPSVSKLIDKPIEIKTKEQFIEEFDNLASIMVSCFDTFGKGEVDFLSPKAYESDPFCFKCAEINFNKDLAGQNLDPLKDYIKKESPIASEETYSGILKEQYGVSQKVPENGVLYITFMASTNTVWNKIKQGKYDLYNYLFGPDLRDDGISNPKIVIGDSNEINSLCSSQKQQPRPMTEEEIKAQEEEAEFWDVYRQSPGL